MRIFTNESPKLSVKRHKHSDTSRFVVDGLMINGKRVRRFFATRQEADTFAGQKQLIRIECVRRSV